MENQDVLKIRANYNGNEFTVKLVGESAEIIADLLWSAFKGKPLKDIITDYA